MNRIIMTLLLLVLLVPTAFAAPDLDTLAADAPGLAEYPLADQITLYEHTDIQVDAEGRMTRRVHRIRKILTNWAMRRVADPRVDWDSSRQTLEIEVCRTRQSDGAIIDSPANALNEVTPDAVGHCARFLDLREMVISHVGLEPGCVTELIYTIRDLEPAPLPPSGRIFLQDRWPVLERSITLSGAGVRSEIRNAGDLTLETEGSTIVARNLPGLPDAVNAHRADFVPYLVYSVATGDWEELAGRIAAAGDAARVLNEDMRTWLQSGEDLTAIDTIQRIAALVGDRTRTVHLPGGLFARSPRATTEVFHSGCASRWEEALLAFTLLDGLSLNPSLVLAGDLEVLPKKAFAVETWNRLLVSVAVDGQKWWVSPERGEAWPGSIAETNTHRLTILGQSAGSLTHSVVAGQACAMNISIVPDDSGLVLSIDWRANGMLRGHETDADELAETLVHAVLPGADVTATEILQLDPSEAHLRIEAQADDLGTFDDGILVLDLPTIPDGVLSHLPHDCRLQEPVRHSPLILPGGMRQEMRLHLELPEGVEVDYLPTAEEAIADGSRFRMDPSRSDGMLELDCRLELQPGPIASTDWPLLRKMLIRARNVGEGRIVLVQP